MTTVRRAGRLPRVAWVLGALIATYVALGWLFEWVSQVRGLLSPGGTPNLDVVVLGGVYLLLRVTVRFIVPFVLVFHAARALAVKLLARSGG
jgi:hypothetical protein